MTQTCVHNAGCCGGACCEVAIDPLSATSLSPAGAAEAAEEAAAATPIDAVAVPESDVSHSHGTTPTDAVAVPATASMPICTMAQRENESSYLYSQLGSARAWCCVQRAIVAITCDVV